MSTITLSEDAYAYMRRFGAPTETDQAIIERLCALTQEHLEFLLTHEHCVQASKLLAQKT